VPHVNPDVSNEVAATVSGSGLRDEWPAGYFDQSCGFLIEDIQEPSDPAARPGDVVDVP
jgi:hypothetical protein